MNEPVGPVSPVRDPAPPDTRLAEIEARLNAATPGPWKVYNCWGPEEYTGRMAAIRVGTDALRSGIHAAEGADLYATKPDFEFIAHAPDDIRYLLGLVRGVRDPSPPAISAEKLRVGLGDLLNSYCRGCNALTSVGEVCDAHRWIFDSLNALEDGVRGSGVVPPSDRGGS